MLTINKLSETSSTITLGWTPPPNADVYVFYANNKMVSFAGRNNKDGTARTSVKFSKATPGPPFDVVAVCHNPYALEVGTYPATPPPPPPPSGALLTGTHWPDQGEFQTLKNVGYGFGVTTVQPGDTATAKAKLDAAKAAGIKLIIGLYPEPYTWDGTRWTITSAGITSLNYFASRQDEIVSLFVFNEPYWVKKLGCNELRLLRTQIRGVWPDAKVYHDIGEPSGWVPGGPYSGGSTKWADQSGVCDHCGFWKYPFTSGGYQKSAGLAVIAKEVPFIQAQMGAVPVFLGQSHAAPSENLVYPTSSDLSDWNKAIRGALPAGSLISWYVWRQAIYTDYLANHPEQWPATV